MNSSELVRLEGTIAYRLRGLGLSPSDRDDIRQQAFEAYLTSPEKIRHPEAWIGLVAYRKGIRSKYTNRMQPLLEEPRCEGNEEPCVDLRRALEAARPETRELLVRRFIDGATIDELVSAGFGSASTVKRRMNKAVAFIRRRVA